MEIVNQLRILSIESELLNLAALLLLLVQHFTDSSAIRFKLENLTHHHLEALYSQLLPPH